MGIVFIFKLGDATSGVIMHVQIIYTMIFILQVGQCIVTAAHCLEGCDPLS